MKYHLSEIEALRKNVRDAYRAFTNGGELDLNTTKGNPYYEALGEALKTALNKTEKDIPSEGVLMDFFLDNEHLSFYPKTIKTFRDFINVCAPLLGLRTSFKGCDIIDSTFRDTVLQNGQGFSHIDFYTAKQNDDCQWFGIIKGWDCERKDYEKIKDTIFNSFQKFKNNKVSAVICGMGGSGKSTILRRLAIDCIDCDFSILWINDLSAFNENIDKIKSNIESRYLLIIDDWEKIKSHSQTANLFLSKTSQLKNARIIISDRDTYGKEYLDYFNEKHNYYLSSDENSKIIEEVIANNSAWKVIPALILTKPKFYESSLYLILFIIARSHLKITNNESFDLDDVLSQFKSIIRNDQKKIYQVYPGLAKALFYWACLGIEYKYAKFFTWESFLKLSDYYNGDNNVSKEILYFSKTNPICKILSNYISLEPLIVPFNTHIFSIHHDLLIEEGLSQSITEDWFYDDHVKLEIIDILYAKGELLSAKELYERFEHGKNFFKTPEQENFYYKRFRDVERTLSDDLHCNKRIHGYMPYAKLPRDNEYWMLCIIEYVMFLDFPYYNKEILSVFFKMLVENGCKAKVINSLYKASLISSDRMIIKMRIWYKGTFASRYMLRRLDGHVRLKPSQQDAYI